MIISRLTLLEIRIVLDKRCIEKENTHFTLIFNKYISENYNFYEMIWKNMLEPDGPHII
jgi:hypothetical protein